MVYDYARISTKSQVKDGNSLEVQVEILKTSGSSKIYSDAFTGTKSDRPQFSKLMNEIASSEILSLLQKWIVLQEVYHKGVA